MSLTLACIKKKHNYDFIDKYWPKHKDIIIDIFCGNVHKYENNDELHEFFANYYEYVEKDLDKMIYHYNIVLETDNKSNIKLNDTNNMDQPFDKLDKLFDTNNMSQLFNKLDKLDESDESGKLNKLDESDESDESGKLNKLEQLDELDKLEQLDKLDEQIDDKIINNISFKQNKYKEKYEGALIVLLVTIFAIIFMISSYGLAVCQKFNYMNENIKLKELRDIANGNIYSYIGPDKNNSYEIYNELGKYYKNEKNDAKATHYYLKAIGLNNSNSDALLNLGKIYEDGKNYNKMREYYLKAINLNHTGAMFQMGKYYHLIEQNNDKAIYYYEMTINNYMGKTMDVYGINATFYLGYIYNDEEKYIQMIDLYKKAIDYNCSTAMNSLAKYYENKGDYNTMINLYEKAILHDNVQAMRNLANHYLKHITKNNSFHIHNVVNKMKFLFELAIKFNDIDSMVAYANYYKNTENDYDKAIYYYEKAAELGHIDSIYELASYYDRINDIRKSNNYYELAKKVILKNNLNKQLEQI